MRLVRAWWLAKCGLFGDTSSEGRKTKRHVIWETKNQEHTLNTTINRAKYLCQHGCEAITLYVFPLHSLLTFMLYKHNVLTVLFHHVLFASFYNAAFRVHQSGVGCSLNTKGTRLSRNLAVSRKLGSHLRWLQLQVKCYVPFRSRGHSKHTDRWRH